MLSIKLVCSRVFVANAHGSLALIDLRKKGRYLCTTLDADSDDFHKHCFM